MANRCGIATLLVAGLGTLLFTFSRRSDSSAAAAVAAGSAVYRGYQFWNENQTLKVRTLVETPFARAQVHTVKLENGKTITDWLWYTHGPKIAYILMDAS